jgi:hypothetical protein
MRKLRCHRQVIAELLLYQLTLKLETDACHPQHLKLSVISYQMTALMKGSTRS